MSSLHPEESLVEALYFALELAIPEDEPPDVRSPVVAAVQQPWLEETRSLLNDQERLRRLWSGDG